MTDVRAGIAASDEFNRDSAFMATELEADDRAPLGFNHCSPGNCSSSVRQDRTFRSALDILFSGEGSEL